MAVQRMWREKKFLCIDFAGFQFFRQRREHRSLHAAKQSDASQLFHGRRTGYALHGSDWPDESASLAPFMTTSAYRWQDGQRSGPPRISVVLISL